MKKWGVILLAVGVLLLAASFGSEMVVKQNLPEGFISDIVTPEAIQKLLDTSDRYGVTGVVMENMDLEDALRMACMRVYTKSETMNMVACISLGLGGLLTIAGQFTGKKN